MSRYIRKSRWFSGDVWRETQLEEPLYIREGGCALLEGTMAHKATVAHKFVVDAMRPKALRCDLDPLETRYYLDNCKSSGVWT